MRQNIINGVAAGTIIGVTGLVFTTWQFWVVTALICVIVINSLDS